LPQTVQQFVALADPTDEGDSGLPPTIPMPQLRTDADRGRERAQALGLDLSKPVIALMPGAEYGPAKRWPAEAFAALARRLVASGRTVWVFGVAKERALGDQIAAVEGAANLCGKTSLTDVIDLLELAEAAVSNDSGLMHVAAAVGARLVAIYGSSSPGHTPPMTNRAEIVYHALECSPCYQRECPLGHLNCLRGISVEEVLGRLG
jgi:heptosyltransferase-2